MSSGLASIASAPRSIAMSTSRALRAAEQMMTGAGAGRERVSQGPPNRPSPAASGPAARRPVDRIESFQRRESVRGERRLVPVGLQHHPEERQDVRFVLHDQHERTGFSYRRLLLGPRVGKRDDEGGPAAGASSAWMSPPCPHQCAHDGQPESDARLLPIPLEPAEPLEGPLAGRFGHTGPGVDDAHVHRPGLVRDDQPDGRWTPYL